MIEIDYELDESYENDAENTTSNSLLAGMYTQMSTNTLVYGGTVAPLNRE